MAYSIKAFLLLLYSVAGAYDYVQGVGSAGSNYYFYGDTADAAVDSDFLLDGGYYGGAFAGKFTNANVPDWITLTNGGGDFRLTEFNSEGGVDKQSWLRGTLKFKIQFNQSYQNTDVPDLYFNYGYNNGKDRNLVINISDQIDLNEGNWQEVSIPLNTSAFDKMDWSEFDGIKFTTWTPEGGQRCQFKLDEVRIEGLTEIIIHNRAIDEEGTPVAYQVTKLKSIDASDKIPVWIHLHGNSSGLSDFIAIDSWWGWRELINRSGYSTYFFEPRSGGETGTLNNWQVNALIDHILAIYEDADPNRIYISGYSAGGFRTCRYAIQYGQRIAAAISIEGGISGWNNADYEAADLRKLMGMPIWLIHNVNDQVVRPISSERFVSYAQGAGAAVEYQANPDGDHAIQLHLNITQELCDWLFSNNRQQRLIKYATGGRLQGEQKTPASLQIFSDKIRFSFFRAADPVDVTYKVQTSENLKDWYDYQVNLGNVGENVAVDIDLSEPGQFFMRLNVEALEY